MKRMLITVAALVASVSACGSDPPASAPPQTTTKVPSSTPASSATSATPSGSPSALIEFSVDGAGPYQLGATLTTLQSAPGLEAVTAGGNPKCPDVTIAHGTGTWREVELSFHKDGTLYLAVNRSTAIPTPSGAWLGTNLTDLKKIYAGIPGQALTRGTANAYLVTTLSGRGILFDLDTSKSVSAMTAGEANYLRATFQSGAGFC